MAPSHEHLVGRVVGGRYRLDRAIGVGGMGAVFQATQLDLGRAVAVKVLLDADAQSIARLRQEAITAGTLSCPYVVSIFDFQAPEGEAPFVVMELLAGESVAQRLARQPVLPVAEACRIAVEALIGIDFAHRAGVLHRDIKPSNLWLSSGRGMEGHVKVLDFGIAKSVTDAGVQTTTGALLGTPAYLSPEQLRGQEAGERSDQHAIGVVLFEMLTGARPWRAQGVALYAEVLERVPPRVNELAPHVPPELAGIIARALAKDPAARFASADELRLHLAPYAQTASSSPHAAPLPQPPQSFHLAPASTLAPPRGPASGGSLGWIFGIVVLLSAGVAIYVVARQPGATQATPSVITSSSTSATVAAPSPSTEVTSTANTPPERTADGSSPVTPAKAPSASGASTATAGPSGRMKPNCECIDAHGRLICTRAMTPRCTCLQDGFNVCPVPTEGRGDCPVKHTWGNFTGAGLKTGGTCSGFRHVYRADGAVSVPETGTLSCLACYGRPKEPAVPGTRCEGMRSGTYVPEFTRAGEWVCDP